MRLFDFLRARGFPLSGVSTEYVNGLGLCSTPAGGSGDYVSTLANSEVSITTTATATISKQHVCSGSSAYTVTLPAASGNTGKFLSFRITSTNIITIDGNGSETIDGVLTRIMWLGETATLYCDGSNWFKVAGRSIPMICRMALSASQTGVAAVTVTKVNLNRTDIDNTGLMASTGSSQITLKRSGNYNMIGRVRWNAYVATAAGERIEGDVYLTNTSGTNLAVGEQMLANTTTGSYAVCNAVEIYPGAAGDVLILAGYHENALSRSFYGGAAGSGCSLLVEELLSW